MLNPGYSVIAKKGKIERDMDQEFICPNCKKTCLAVADDPGKFLTKCSSCRRWVYGEKILANITKNH